MKDEASVPLITQALESEKDPQVQLNMATALSSFGSPAGRQALLRLCDDASLSENLRLDAASRVVNSDDPGCLASVTDILQQATNPVIKTYALSTLARSKAIPASLAPSVHAALLASLQDSDPIIRSDASKCIAALNDKSAIPELEAAIAREPDESTRKHMQAALAVLKQNL
jgi:HEAT repeat protein